jgi:diadenosine tetraphosphatase ApaH/serine/threonine PP2A family protein phosphatase
MALIALLSDIHSNLSALEVCVEAAEAAGVDRFVLLGDYVGYGGDPGPVLERVIELVGDGAIAIRGNHDDMGADFDSEMNELAASAANWTRRQLAPDQLAFLDALPMSAREDDRLYVHGDASDPAAWHYVTGPSSAAISLAASPARITFSGHVHKPAIFAHDPVRPPLRHTPAPGVPVPLMASRRWHVVLGAVGQPRDGDPDASWALFDTGTSEITFERTAYDIDRAASAILAAGLPTGLARRLYQGI